MGKYLTTDIMLFGTYTNVPFLSYWSYHQGQLVAALNQLHTLSLEVKWQIQNVEYTVVLKYWLVAAIMCDLIKYTLFKEGKLFHIKHA